MGFSDSVWWTRKARIQTEKRLLSNAFQSQLLLLWYSFFSVATAVYYLVMNRGNGDSELDGLMWVVFSVLVLCVSGFINGLTFKERAGLIKECYETLNNFHQKLKIDQADLAKLSSEYNQILGVCENHSDRDYYLALCLEHVTNSGSVDSETGLKEGLDRRPTWCHWLFTFLWFFRRFMMLFILYALPIGVFVALRCVE